MDPRFHYQHLGPTACGLAPEPHERNLTNVMRLVNCPECINTFFHLAARDTNTGIETACGTQSKNLASRWSKPLVSCPECLVSERFRNIENMPGRMARRGWEGDQS